MAKGLYSVLAVLATLSTATNAQSSVVYKSQNSTFNSSYSLSPQQIQAVGLSRLETQNLELSLNFERSKFANGGTLQDAFYTELPPLVNGTVPPPGTLLKAQRYTNTSAFSLPANVALSRIIYTTKDLNGTILPASAFVLWPFQPRKFASASNKPRGPGVSAPVALWLHGTSGWFPSGAPSSFRSLWYDYTAPFVLALQGYAVVAPDFAGLGVGKSWDNSSIPHQYLASPASANDGLYSLKAAHAAFPGLLDERFVSIGHSQGGGVAWAVSEALQDRPELGTGFLGSIAVSPTTDLFGGPLSSRSLIGPFCANGLSTLFPEFKLSDWLTPDGIARLNLAKQLQITASGIGLFSTDKQIVKDNYTETWSAKAYAKLANVGRKAFKGPMLVIQGTEDPYIPYALTNKTVTDTIAKYPYSDLEFLVVNGTGHVPTLDATQSIWTKWIEDRFEGKPIAHRGYKRTDLDSFLPHEQYQATHSSWVQWGSADEYSYETIPLAI